MADKDPATRLTQVGVGVRLHQSASGEPPPKAFAYAFTDNGRFIAQAPVGENGQAVLNLPAPRAPQDFRIVVGPEIPAAEAPEQPSIFSQLTRRGAQEQFLRVSSESRDLRAQFEIPADIWVCWIRFCLVKGTLLKRIYSSGIAVDYPVCGADVQIWEVDPIYIVLSKLTNAQLSKISQYLLNPQPLPPGPDPPDSLVKTVGNIGRLETAKPVETLQSFTTASPEFDVAHRAALSGDLVAFRQSLASISEIAARFLICRLFPRLVTKRLIATAHTDRCGRFQTFVFYRCFDALDLYFTASISIYGFSFPIYEPTPVSCYTHWNYRCATEVTLFTTSPFAPLCAPCGPVDAPENYVLFRALGNVQLNGIYGASTTLSGSTNATNIGQAADLYGAGLDSPFGGVVLPRLEFDSSLRALNKAMYYQISYRKGTSGSFTVLPGQIDRKYNHYVGMELVTSPYNLGPKTVGAVTNLFEIPPALPPEGEWAFPDPPKDHANAQFPTTELPSPLAGGTFGKYQLKVDLFDAAGNPVDIATAGIGYFVPTTVDPDGTIHTANAASLGMVSGNSMILTVHVDNRETSGSLGTPALDGTPADDCGVFRYNAGPSGNVTIPYTASHPDNMATYSYRLSRGATPLTPPTTSGQVSGATNPAVVSMSVLSLLTQPDGTVCDVAGFAEDLYVAALATDGWSRLSEYDTNPPPRAFVLAPKP
jgi:hypothetical protein